MNVALSRSNWQMCIIFFLFFFGFCVKTVLWNILEFLKSKSKETWTAILQLIIVINDIVFFIAGVLSSLLSVCDHRMQFSPVFNIMKFFVWFFQRESIYFHVCLWKTKNVPLPENYDPVYSNMAICLAVLSRHVSHVRSSIPPVTGEKLLGVPFKIILNKWVYSEANKTCLQIPDGMKCLPSIPRV